MTPMTGVSPQVVARALDAGEGILHLAPTWVPRSFLVPGRRLKLHPDDLYALGADRGGIDERWLGSTTRADNEGAPPDEGLSYVVGPDGRFPLRDAIGIAGEQIIGRTLLERHGGWKVYSKFFDNMGPIPHHLHQREQHARLVGREPKPEAYYFPPQLNATGNRFPHTFFGLEPGTTRDDLRRCLERWNEGDNGVLDLSKAYRLQPGTGWLVQGGILHAPGSLVTYEPQWASDVFAMYQSMVEERVVPWSLLVKDVPPDKHRDLDYLLDLVDWDANVDPHFKAHHFLPPIPLAPGPSEGCVDRWVVYGRVEGKPILSARELTVQPGASMTLRDGAASCAVAVQGRGMLGPWPVETPLLIRFGELTNDEFFISEPAARGVRVRNTGTEPLVLLRYFGPESIDGVPEIASAR